uniref:40S ribosomal protein S15 n=1 Tax=Steinernema glaseri TaxID=37863 RepID=A0A1I7Z5R1_9BILA
MFGRVMKKFTNRCASTVKKKRRMGKREVDNTSQKTDAGLMHHQVMSFELPVYGYMNTINVTNLEKFLRMQIDIKAHREVELLKKTKE